jgi:pimeloyl-ACP methyl ester carboxylesterase
MFEGLVRAFLYHPTVLPPEAPLPPYIRGAREVWLDAADGNRIHGLQWPAPPGRPTILFLHGNAQSVFEWGLISEELAPLECGLLLIDYPGYGKSSGSPNEAGLTAAGDVAIEWLGQVAGVPEYKVVVFGKSLGGGVASRIAQGRRLRGVVLESTFRSIPHVARRLLPMLPVGAVISSERYETIERIGGIRAPILVVHGTEDELIPVAEGKALFEAAPRPKELYLVEGAGHNDVSWTAGQDYARRLRQWLDGVAQKE